MKNLPNYEQEINRLLNEALKLEEKAKLDYETAVFLDGESKKLKKIIDNPPSAEALDDATKKLEILYSRIRRELNENEDNMNKIEIAILEIIKKELEQ